MITQHMVLSKGTVIQVLLETEVEQKEQETVNPILKYRHKQVVGLEPVISKSTAECFNYLGHRSLINIHNYTNSVSSLWKSNIIILPSPQSKLSLTCYPQNYLLSADNQNHKTAEPRLVHSQQV